MDLKKYHEKRDFERTPEPEGKVEPSTTGKLYIIQKHAASRLHYDLRLELDGVLKSWAVPKGPSLKPGEKRLAVHVEDHPVEYGSFEGVIPEHEYGGGTVMLWDRGWWEPDGDPRQGYSKGDFKFRLFGEKLKGSWVLARMKGEAGEEGKNWLLIKKRDEAAITNTDPEPVETLDRSVASGRSMREIAAERDKVWFKGSAVPGTDATVETHEQPNKRGKRARKTEHKSSAPPPPTIDPSTLPGVRPAPQPELFRPELATLVGTPPIGPNWIHEIKYDGYRILCMLSNGRARLVSRNGIDWTSKFAAIAEDAAGIPLQNAILDGEIVVVDSEGKTDFQALQNILKGVGTGRLVYYVFDIPHCQGYDLTRVPLLDRKALLDKLMKEFSIRDGSVIRYTGHIRGEGETVTAHACRLGLEGIVSKQADSPYEQKRSRRWVKVKCGHRQEFVIGGFTEPGGSRTGFRALLLGYYDPSGNLVYSGRVGTGFDDRMLHDMILRLREIESQESSFINPPTGYEARGIHWTKPEMVAEVEFSAWTDEGILRHPSFKGLREDKHPREITRESAEPIIPDNPTGRDEKHPKGEARQGRNQDTVQTVVSAKEAKTHQEKAGGTEQINTRMPEDSMKRSGATRTTASLSKVGIPDQSGSFHSAQKRGESAAPGLPPKTNARRGGGKAGFPLSNPDRVLYPEIGVTKRTLAEYYADIADWIIPHLLRRPLTLVRCPEGWEHECFYQKHLGDMAPAVLRAIPIMEKKGEEEYSLIDNLQGITALVQIGVLEIHVWGCREEKLEQPDMMIFDLDPDPDVPWERAVQGAFLTRDLLVDLGLRSFVKTTGGKGLHVVVPLTPRADWSTVKEFSRAVAESIVRESPREYIATMSKAKRKGKIFIDYLRNGRGATSISAYSTRKRPGAPISTPVSWEELTPDLRADSFTIENIRRRLSSLKSDPWEGYFSVRQSLTAKMKKQMGLTT